MAFRLHLIFFQVVKNTAVTNDGEIAEKNVYEIDEEQIIGTLRSMKMTLLNTANGYVPSYTRTEITDSLHKTFHHVFSAYQIFFITAFLHSLFLPDVPPRYRFHDGSFPRSSSQSGWKSHALPSLAYQLHMS